MFRNYMLIIQAFCNLFSVQDNMLYDVCSGSYPFENDKRKICNRITIIVIAVASRCTNSQQYLKLCFLNMKISQIALLLLLSAPINFSLAKSYQDQGRRTLLKPGEGKLIMDKPITDKPITDKPISGAPVDNNSECSPFIMYNRVYELHLEGKPDQ